MVNWNLTKRTCHRPDKVVFFKFHRRLFYGKLYRYRGKSIFRHNVNVVAFKNEGTAVLLI